MKYAIGSIIKFVNLRDSGRVCNFELNKVRNHPLFLGSGSVVFKENKGTIVDYENEVYMVSYIDEYGNSLCFGFKEQDIELLSPLAKDYIINNYEIY